MPPTVSPAEPRLGARVALQQSPILPEGKSHYKVNHYSTELPIYTKQFKLPIMFIFIITDGLRINMKIFP
ncbi:hypothetical protein JOC37_000269 [Desulfohalotomaculum tongense]|nr:hypothetical protein [Desulforadius tongensis]